MCSCDVSGIAQHDAEDLTQAFFADLIKSRTYARPIHSRGGFARSCLEH